MTDRVLTATKDRSAVDSDFCFDRVYGELHARLRRAPLPFERHATARFQKIVVTLQQLRAEYPIEAREWERRHKL